MPTHGQELETPQAVTNADGVITVYGAHIVGVSYFVKNISATQIKVGYGVAFDFTVKGQMETPDARRSTAAGYGPTHVLKPTILRGKGGVLGDYWIGIALEDIDPGQVGEVGGNGTIVQAFSSISNEGQFVVGGGVAGQLSSTATRLADPGQNLGTWITQDEGPNSQYGMILVSIH